MLGLSTLAEAPIGVAASLDFAPSPVRPAEKYLLEALRSYLLFILPVGTEVVRGQVNRVPPPKVSDYAVMTLLARQRVSTNIDQYADVVFNGSTSGDILTVTEMVRGEIVLRSTLTFVGADPATQIIEFLTGAGGPGTYRIDTAQDADLRRMAASYATLMMPTDVTVQIDLHGPNAGDNTAIVEAALRDGYGTQWFEEAFPGVTPLYADNRGQVPFINDSKQYEDRWVVDAHLQIDPAVSLPLQFADEVEVTPIPVDVIYPID